MILPFISSTDVRGSSRMTLCHHMYMLTGLSAWLELPSRLCVRLCSIILSYTPYNYILYCYIPYTICTEESVVQGMLIKQGAEGTGQNIALNSKYKKKPQVWTLISSSGNVQPLIWQETGIWSHFRSIKLKELYQRTAFPVLVLHDPTSLANSSFSLLLLIQ